MSYKEMEKDLVHPLENKMRAVNVVLFFLALIASIAAIVAVIMMPDFMDPEDRQNVVVMFVIIGAVIFQMGRQYGRSRAESVQLSEKQFPEVYEIVKDFSERLEMGSVPEVYLTQEGGVLNAFATSFFSRKFISINSAIFEIAYLEHKDIDTVAFVIAHELAHLKREHATTLRLILEFFGGMVPIWGPAQSRVKEYTCDRHAAWLAPDGKEGLILLAVGKHLYKKVDIDDYIDTSSHYRGFFYWLHNLLASHPVGPKRIKALVDQSTWGSIF